MYARAVGARNAIERIEREKSGELYSRRRGGTSPFTFPLPHSPLQTPAKQQLTPRMQTRPDRVRRSPPIRQLVYARFLISLAIYISDRSRCVRSRLVYSPRSPLMDKLGFRLSFFGSIFLVRGSSQRILGECSLFTQTSSASFITLERILRVVTITQKQIYCSLVNRRCIHKCISECTYIFLSPFTLTLVLTPMSISEIVSLFSHDTSLQ